MFARFVGIVLACAALAACSNRPLLQPHPLAFQPEFASAAQWNEVASFTAQDIVEKLNYPDTERAGHIIAGAQQPAPMSGRPFYIEPGRSAFERMFGEMLKQQLMKRDRVIATHPEYALIVNVRTHMIRHGSDPLPGYPGPVTVASGVALYAYYAQRWSAGEIIGTALPLAAALEGYAYLTHTPSTEILLTTAIVEGPNYIFKADGVYYVADNDSTLYRRGTFPPERPLGHRSPVVETRTVSFVTQ